MKIHLIRAGLACGVALSVLAAMPPVPQPHKREFRFPAVESPQELMQSIGNRAAKAGVVPDGALRAAIERKNTMAPLTAKVAGANGQWAEYGVGNLNDGATDLNGNSIAGFQAARVDNFAYDAVNKRLFIAVGTGGVWMSEAVGGDVTTIGDLWTSVGDKLPTQTIGGVGWSPANGGTLIAAGGEAVMGSGAYLGLGAYWSTNLGTTWTHAAGFPDAALVFRVAVDESNPNVAYIASSKGLFRTSDAGRSYVNVALPTTPDCAGVEDVSSKCFYTNYVTDVVVQVPGGSTNVTCSADGCPVLAGVGFRTGRTAVFQDGMPQAPGNGLYKSSNGLPGSFAHLDVGALDTNLPVGFTPDNRVGRIEMNVAFGPDQDHNYVYAMVQDSQLFNGGGPGADGLGLLLDQSPLGFPSYFNGIYVSADFGESWIRMADTQEVINNTSGSEIAAIGGALGSGAGIQAWYNEWIAVDPTSIDPTGVPTRLAFGLEEVWQSRVPAAPLNGAAQSGPSDFEVIGTYFNIAGQFASTTHPDQHAGIYIPTDDGGVCLFAGNDGGVFKQCVAANGIMDNNGWGFGANTGMYTLLPYGLAVAKDGTVWFGLQDNGSGLIDPRRGKQLFTTMGGDGFYAEVDPDNSDVAYTETQNGGLTRTVNRGGSNQDIAPSYTRVMFDNWFRMDPLDAQHMVTAAQEVYETASAEQVAGDTWVEVFNLGTNPETNAIRTTTTIEIHGTAVYVGGCGDCGVSGNGTVFQNVLATNVMDGVTRQTETSAGWHLATAAGLDNRYITGIAIDPNDVKTIYVSLGGYLSAIRPPGAYLDMNANIGSGAVFKSTDAGESFTNISGNLPDMQAATVILRGSQLLVGTDFGTFISSDTHGTEWAPLGNGLPAVPVNMLRLKPDDPDKLFAATFGRNIWIYDFATSVIPPPAVVPAKPDEGRFGTTALSLPLLLTLLLGVAIQRRRTAR